MVEIANFDQDRYAATSATRCVQIFIPDDDSYMALLGGLLALASYPDNYRDPESAQAEGVSAIWRDAYIQSDWEGCVVPEMTTITDLWLRYGTTTATALVYNAAAAQPFAHFMTQNPAASGDIMRTNDVYLQEGTYQYRGLWLRDNSSAIVECHLMNSHGFAVETIFTGLDLYGGFLANQVNEQEIDVPANDKYYIRLRVTGKNAASPGYKINWTSHHLWRTGN